MDRKIDKDKLKAALARAKKVEDEWDGMATKSNQVFQEIGKMFGVHAWEIDMKHLIREHIMGPNGSTMIPDVDVFIAAVKKHPRKPNRDSVHNCCFDVQERIYGIAFELESEDRIYLLNYIRRILEFVESNHDVVRKEKEERRREIAERK